MNKKFLTLACLFALIMPLVACGGGDDTTPTEESPASPTESPS